MARRCNTPEQFVAQSSTILTRAEWLIEEGDRLARSWWPPRRRLGVFMLEAAEQVGIEIEAAAEPLPPGIVEPDPAKGSNNRPRGGVTRRTSQRMRSTGLTVGCLEPNRSCASALAE